MKPCRRDQRWWNIVSRGAITCWIPCWLRKAGTVTAISREVAALQLEKIGCVAASINPVDGGVGIRPNRQKGHVSTRSP